MKKKTISMILAGAGLVLLAYAVDKIYPRLAAEELPRADRVIVEKSQRKLTLLAGGQAIKTYTVSLGGNPVGHKTQEGDSRTPEGVYRLDWRNPKSCCHLSMHVSYPNAADRKRARELGVFPGGNIMIHGLPNWLGGLGFVLEGQDWTDGCIGVGNTAMEEIWHAVPIGTPIEIRP